MAMKRRAVLASGLNLVATTPCLGIARGTAMSVEEKLKAMGLAPFAAMKFPPNLRVIPSLAIGDSQGFPKALAFDSMG